MSMMNRAKERSRRMLFENAVKRVYNLIRRMEKSGEIKICR